MFVQAPAASVVPDPVQHSLVRAPWSVHESEPQGAEQVGVPAPLPFASGTSAAALAHAGSQQMPAPTYPPVSVSAAMLLLLTADLTVSPHARQINVTLFAAVADGARAAQMPLGR